MTVYACSLAALTEVVTRGHASICRDLSAHGDTPFLQVPRH